MHDIESTCCFTGHRPKYFRFGTNEAHPECVQIKEFIREKCRFLIEAGVTHFMSGGALGVDTWAMEEVIGLRETYPRISLECVIPYAGMIERFAPNDRERFARAMRKLSQLTVLKSRYYTGCMQHRNMYMVDRSRYLIAVWTGQRSGTANTIHYAENHKRKILRLSIEN